MTASDRLKPLGAIGTVSLPAWRSEVARTLAIVVWLFGAVSFGASSRVAFAADPAEKDLIHRGVQARWVDAEAHLREAIAATRDP